MTQKKETVYISGKITGLPRSTYLAHFAHAEQLLRREGYRVVNPTRFAVCRWPWLYRLIGYEKTLLYDLWRMTQCQRIFLIPGWQDSQGARIESFTAHVLGIYRLPHGKKDELEEEMKEWMKQRDETSVLQSPREQSIRKCTKEHKKV